MNNTIGWMGSNAQPAIYYKTEPKNQTHYETFVDSDADSTTPTTEFAQFVIQRFEKLRAYFNDDEWTYLQRYHKFDDDVAKQRLLYHWLGTLINDTHKQLLLMLWNKKIFHPFVDILTAENIIRDHNHTQWILRLSTTEAGKITLSYPFIENGIIHINHQRITIISNTLFEWNTKYYSFDELIKEISTTTSNITPVLYG